jgi:hypothetical protein
MMKEDERERLKQKLLEKKAIPGNILGNFDKMKESPGDAQRDAEIKKAFSSLQKKAQKKY